MYRNLAFWNLLICYVSFCLSASLSLMCVCVCVNTIDNDVMLFIIHSTESCLSKTQLLMSCKRFFTYKQNTFDVITNKVCVRLYWCFTRKSFLGTKVRDINIHFILCATNFICRVIDTFLNVI